MGDPEQFAASLRVVASRVDLAALPPDTDALMAPRLDDALLAAIAEQASGVRHIISDGSGRVTDPGLSSLVQLTRLESLDLEWSRAVFRPSRAAVRTAAGDPLELTCMTQASVYELARRK